jgi:hypothetical protein
MYDLHSMYVLAKLLIVDAVLYTTIFCLLDDDVLCPVHDLLSMHAWDTVLLPIYFITPYPPS